MDGGLCGYVLGWARDILLNFRVGAPVDPGVSPYACMPGPVATVSRTETVETVTADVDVCPTAWTRHSDTLGVKVADDLTTTRSTIVG